MSVAMAVCLLAATACRAPTTQAPGTPGTIATTSSPPTTTTPTTTTSSAPATPTTLPTPDAIVSPCADPGATPPPVDGDVVAASQALATALICHATDVVVTAPDTTDETAIRAAVAMGAPLVHALADSPFDPATLGAARVWTADAALVLAGNHAILPIPSFDADVPPLVGSLVDGLVPEEGRADIIQQFIDATPTDDLLVLVSPNRPELAVPAATIAASLDGAVAWTSPGDMRRRRGLAALAEGSKRRLLVGDFNADAAWQVDVLAGGVTLPNGGQTIFPGTRIVALYGHPHTSGLGVLGEQSAEASVARAAEVAAPYATEDTVVVPAFEIITTLASAGPGGDGDYSEELSVDEVRPWVEAATAAGYYVILDLQPGRTDFLTQAKRYEELLVLPNVGLGLDPEWRLGPDEVHLRQIGSVDGAEVNTVVEWLAALVRRENLPQKLLVVHQFTFGMITNRDVIESPTELAVVIQMDGQGPLGSKFATWNALVAGTDDTGWHWGWKNFYDEDDPTASPDQVLGRDPVPVFVSYQ